MAAGGALSSGLFPVAGSLEAALRPTRPGPITAPLSDSDRAVLQILSAYSSDVSFWGGGVFARIAGTAPQDGTIQVAATVTDYQLLTAFWRSEAENSLGVVYVLGNTLSFTLGGTAYTVTNRDPKTAAAAASADEGSAAGFTHEALAYYPATNTLSDPYGVLEKRRIDLKGAPMGGVKASFQTLVRGWLESARYGLKLGRKFKAFQAQLLASQPTNKAAKKVVQALLENISPLAAAFDVDALRPLLTSPLVDASLQRVLGLSADEALAAVARLRAEFTSGDYPDAALWLATLLGPQIQDGTASEWIGLLSGDQATKVAAHAALVDAARLVSGLDR